MPPVTTFSAIVKVALAGDASEVALPPVSTFIDPWSPSGLTGPVPRSSRSVRAGGRPGCRQCGRADHRRLYGRMLDETTASYGPRRVAEPARAPAANVLALPRVDAGGM